MNGDFWTEEWIRLLKTRTESKDIRVLTLWQPWASFVSLGFKQIETRSIPTSYRGKVLIQSAKKSPLVSLHDAKSLLIKPLLNMGLKEKPDYKADALLQKAKALSPSDFPTGAILAIVDLTDCLEMRSYPKIGAYYQSQNEEFVTIHGQDIKDRILIETVPELELAVGDWQLGRYAWKLENIIAAPAPIPYKNGQGLQRLKVERLL